MAPDPRSQADTDDVPAALEAFRSEPDVRRQEAAFVVSRAATLLSLVRPRQLGTSEFRLATEEARELLAAQPVEHFQLGRENLLTGMEQLGAADTRAAEFMRYEWITRRESAEPVGGPGGVADRSRRVTQEVRALSRLDRPALDAAQREAAEELFPPDDATAERGRPRSEPAARLIAASLLDDDLLVQVAAAAAALRADARNPLAEAILDDTARRGSDEMAELSRAILASDRESERRRIEIEGPPGTPDPAADSALIHGTWARWGLWWRPDGSLARYLREQNLFPHLYRGTDPYEWSGYFSFRAWAKPKTDWHRQQAAASLAWWAHRRLIPQPDLIGHSYGGSLAMLATQAEKRVRGIVLLSPAVHRTCLPDPSNYAGVLHVTMKLDLVLLADLSTPRLLRSLPNVTEWPVKRRGLTGHGGTHDPDVWRDSGLADHVRDVWLPSMVERA
jgi:hypothetical protein